MTSLWYAAPAAPVTLLDAVTQAAPVLGATAVGWTSSATAYQMIRLVDGVPHDPSGVADLTGVFSSRVFSERAELRWLHIGAGVGDAVLVTEDSSPDGWPREPAPDIGEVIEGSYALWGRQIEPHSSDGWARAVEGRIGWLDVPVTGPLPPATPPDQAWPAGYLALEYLEYLWYDGHGNARVFEERLLRIAATSPTRGLTRGLTRKRTS